MQGRGTPGAVLNARRKVSSWSYSHHAYIVDPRPHTGVAGRSVGSRKGAYLVGPRAWLRVLVPTPLEMEV